MLAATFRIAALNASMQANMLEALKGGKEMAATQTEVNRLVAETAILLKQIQDEKKASTPAPSD